MVILIAIVGGTHWAIHLFRLAKVWEQLREVMATSAYAAIVESPRMHMVGYFIGPLPLYVVLLLLLTFAVPFVFMRSRVFAESGVTERTPENTEEA